MEFKLLKLSTYDMISEFSKMLTIKDDFFLEIKDGRMFNNIFIFEHFLILVLFTDFIHSLATLSKLLPARGLKRPISAMGNTPEGELDLKRKILEPLVKWMNVSVCLNSIKSSSEKKSINIFSTQFSIDNLYNSFDFV